VSWKDLDRDQISVSPSEVEAQRFGRSMARVLVGHRVTWDDDARRQFAAALDRDEDVLVVRWPSRLAECPAMLVASGRDVLPADSLIYWQGPSELVARSATVDETTPEMRRPDQVDPVELAAAVAAAFKGYVNHYSANPLLDAELALEGYVDWVARTLRADPSNGAILVSDERVFAWGMWVVDPDGDHLEWMLAGVSPEARGRALYGVLMAEAAQEALRRGVPRVVTSTQGANTGIQKVWARAGMLPMADTTTAHLVRRGLLPSAGAHRPD
jgi:GNAT superfamily N-acetyltransferase